MVGPRRDGRPVRVLYVEDDPALARLLTDHFEREGYAVETESDPAAALDRIREGDLDCVVSDYALSGMDGLELLSAVREEFPDLPFVLFTGKGSEGVASDAISAGVDDYVRKGGADRLEVLAQRVENLVEATRARTSYREVFEKATVGLTLHDPETGTLVDANPHYCEMLGYDQDDVQSLSLADVTAGEGPYTVENAREQVRRAVEEGSASFEWLDRGADGDPVWVDVNLRRADIGGREQVLGSVRDVTERKEREQELRAVNDRLRDEAERLDEFASVVSHDLRNPIEVARSHIELARRSGDLDRLDEVEGALERMETIIEGVLTLARRGDQVGETGPVSLSKVAGEAWDTVDTGAATLTVEDGTGAIEADRETVRQLLENLFRNAVEHGDEPAIRVGPLTEGSGFFVADDGPGIPPEDRDRVFERGYTGDGSGTGLGLSIVEAVADAHGWDETVAESAAGGARIELGDVETIGEAWAE